MFVVLSTVHTLLCARVLLLILQMKRVRQLTKLSTLPSSCGLVHNIPRNNYIPYIPSRTRSIRGLHSRCSLFDRVWRLERGSWLV